MASSLLTGKLALTAPDLKEIGPLAGLAMAGELSADITLDAAKGRQSAHLSAAGRRIAAGDAFKTASLDATATAEDLFGKPAISADIKLADPVIADQQLTQVSLTAKGPLSALQAKLSVAGQDLDAATEAEIAQVAAGYRVTVRSLTADVKDIKVKSRKPALITLENDTTRIENVDLAVEDGGLKLNGTVAPDAMELAATIELAAAVPGACRRAGPQDHRPAEWRGRAQRHARPRRADASHSPAPTSARAMCRSSRPTWMSPAPSRRAGWM